MGEEVQPGAFPDVLPWCPSLYRANLCQEPQLFEQFFNTTVGNAKGLASLHEWQALSSIRSSACIMGWALISLSIYQERKKSRRIKIRIQERKKEPAVLRKT